jgi:multidrug resistance efflux pump
MTLNQDQVRERITPDTSSSGDETGTRTETGPAQAGAAPVPPPAPRRRLRLLVLPILLLVVLVVGFFGYRYWQDQQRYVSTDNAFVTGALVQIGSVNAGRIASVSAAVGDPVALDQVVATVKLPSAISGTGSGTTIMGFRGTADQVADVRSSIDGIVVYRDANPGDTISVGQPIVTTVDPSQLWVQAQIEETKISRIRPGEPVEVTVDTLGGRALTGRVIGVDCATAGTFSLIPQNNTSGNFTKVTQLVPVNIALDDSRVPLVYGSSVEVKIQVVDNPGGGNG